MEKKLVYESPKVSRLDDRDSLLGGLEQKCESGSGDVGICASGNNAGVFCRDGSDGQKGLIQEPNDDDD